MSATPETGKENRSRRRNRFINAGRYTMVAIYAIMVLGETASSLSNTEEEARQ